MMRFLSWLLRKRHDKTLYIVRGVSGCGKSSLAQNLTSHAVAADDYPGLYAGGVYRLELQQLAHQWCFEQVEAWMYQGKKAIAVHNTFCKIQYINSFLAIAQKNGYTVQVIHAEGVILSSGKMATNVHGVTKDILQKQKENWENFDV
jgi:predicted kinase